ncbi:MAG: carbohydrate binding domain-containing protein [Lentisphaerota bacterium]
MAPIIHIVLAFATYTSCLSALETNLLKDPGFEDPDSSVWKIWGGWQGMSKEDAQYIKQYDSSAPFAGKYSLKLSDKWEQYRPCIVQETAAAGGGTYKFSFYVKSTVPKMIRVMASYKRKNKQPESEHQSVSVSDVWEQKTILFNKSPADTDSIVVAIWPTAALSPANTAGDEETIWIDNASLTAEAKESSPEDLKKSCSPVNLRSAANRSFSDKIANDGKNGWFNQGENDFSAFPVAQKVFVNIPFDIIDSAGNNGKNCVIVGAPGTTSSEIIVNAKASSVYFLHTAAWCAQKPAVYTVVFANGEKAEITLDKDRDIGDWWQPPFELSNAVVAWTGANDYQKEKSVKVGAYLFGWNNPKPDILIKSITLKTNDGKSQIALIGMTLSALPVCLKTTSSSGNGDTDMTGWFEYPLMFDNFPVDFSFLLDAPAGKRGFVKAKEDGHFYFEDGTRAKFWGTNITQHLMFPEKSDAVKIAATLAKTGFNALRLHIIERDAASGGIIKKGAARSCELDDAQMDKFDFFVAELKKNGIYITIELLPMCGKKFAPGDGVKNWEKLNKLHWGAKGLMFFNDDIYETGKQFAKVLLSHRNKYTGLTYAEEPALALVEFTNEDNLFYFFMIISSPGREEYAATLARIWNDWLVKKYGSKEKLSAQWTDNEERKGLKPDEDPVLGTVKLPPLSSFSQWKNPQNYTGISGSARINECMLFLTEFSSDKYKDMISYLRGLGLKAPVLVSNVVWNQASLKADSICDFIDDHTYFDHVIRGGRSIRYDKNDPRGSWHVEAKYTNEQLTAVNPAKNKTLINVLAFGAISGKPMICTEWDNMPVNDYSPDAYLSVAAFSRLQDYDAMFHFAYAGGFGLQLSDFKLSKLNKTLTLGNPSTLSMLPICAAIYLREDAKSAVNTVEIGFSETDAAYGRCWRLPDGAPEYYLPFISKVRHKFFDKIYIPSPGAKISFSSGYSAFGDYSKAENAVLYSAVPWLDIYNKKIDKAGLARNLFPGIKMAKTEKAELFFSQIGGRKITVQGTSELIETASLPPVSEPVGVTPDGKLCIGFQNGKYLIIPDLEAISLKNNDIAAELYTFFAQKRGELVSKSGFFHDKVVSDTGETSIRFEEGIFTLNTPRTQAVGGRMIKDKKFSSGGGLEISSDNQYCAVAVTSVDGKSLAEANGLIVAVMTRCRNTGSKIRIFESEVNEDEVIQGYGDYEGNSKIKTARKKIYLQTDPGFAPVLIEPIQTKITMTTEKNYQPEIFPVNADGSSANQVPVEFKNGKYTFNTNGINTLYYKIIFNKGSK